MATRRFGGLVAVLLGLASQTFADASTKPSRPPPRRPLLTRQQKVDNALARAEAEQAVEDYNSFQRSEGSLHRRVICLPLTEHFDPPPGQQGHGKLQVSDRVSIPKELMTGVFVRKPVPPWQFELRKLPAELKDSSKCDADDENTEDEDEGNDEVAADEQQGAAAKAKASSSAAGEPSGLDHLFCHVLDWQAPRNYVFVPRWMFQAMQLKPREVVEFTWVRLREAAQVTLKPKTKDFSSWANPQAVMESELKYYSSLTLGSTIVIAYKGGMHELEVVKVKSGDELLDGANIQDVNVAVDFELPPQPKRKKPPTANPAKKVKDETSTPELVDLKKEERDNE